MSRDRTLLHQLYLHDPASLVWLFERNEESLVVMVVNERRRVIYANEVARWAFGLAGGIPLANGQLEAVEGGFLGDMIKCTMTPGATDATVMRTLKTVLDEEWAALAALTVFDGNRAAALIIGRRSLRKRDRATRMVQAARPSNATDRLLNQVGFAWIRSPRTRLPRSRRSLQAAEKHCPH